MSKVDQDQLVKVAFRRERTNGARREREVIRLEIQRMKFDIEREIQRRDMMRNKELHDTFTRAMGSGTL